MELTGENFKSLINTGNADKAKQLIEQGYVPVSSDLQYVCQFRGKYRQSINKSQFKDLINYIIKMGVNFDADVYYIEDMKSYYGCLDDAIDPMHLDDPDGVNCALEYIADMLIEEGNDYFSPSDEN